MDAVAINENGSKMLKPIQCELLRAERNGKDEKSKVTKADWRYSVLLPGENLNLQFKKSQRKKNKKIFYALFVKGYLYEWVLTRKPLNESRFNVFKIITPKIKALKVLLGDVKMFLPSIYAEWKINRNKFGSALRKENSKRIL